MRWPTSWTWPSPTSSATQRPRHEHLVGPRGRRTDSDSRRGARGRVSEHRVAGPARRYGATSSNRRPPSLPEAPSSATAARRSCTGDLSRTAMRHIPDLSRAVLGGIAALHADCRSAWSQPATRNRSVNTAFTQNLKSTAISQFSVDGPVTVCAAQGHRPPAERTAVPISDRSRRVRHLWLETLHPLLWWTAFTVGMFVVVDASIAATGSAPLSSEQSVAHDGAARSQAPDQGDQLQAALRPAHVRGAS